MDLLPLFGERGGFVGVDAAPKDNDKEDVCVGKDRVMPSWVFSQNDSKDASEKYGSVMVEGVEYS